MAIYVTLRVYLRPGDEEQFEQTYYVVSRKLQGHIPGQLSDELLRPVSATEPYILLSQWESLEAHQAWTATSQHRDDVMPLRQHWLRTDSQEYVPVNSAAAGLKGEE